MTRKYLTAYAVWNKEDAVVPILKGIAKSIKPIESDLLFVFDGCTDNSFENYRKNVLTDYINNYIINVEEQYEFKCHNQILTYAKEHGYDATIIFQDDHILDHRNLIDHIDKILDKYGDSIGIIGGRDGFNMLYHYAVGSSWSEPKENRIRDLAPGEFCEMKCINFGPAIYAKSTVTKIGLLDTNSFTFFQADLDYSCRSLATNLKNVVMGTNLKHEKIGKVSASKVYYDNISAKDSASYNRKVSEGYYKGI